MNIEELKTVLDKARATLVTISPFLSSILRKARIIATKTVETAGVNERGVVFVNPDFFSKLNFKETVWVLLHEVCHVAYLHPYRGKNKHPRVYNIAADSVVNDMLEDFIKYPSEKVKRFAVSGQKLYWFLRNAGIEVDSEDFMRMSADERYKLLMKVPWPKGGELQCPNCGSKNIVCKKLVIKRTHAVGRFKCKSCGYEWEAEVEVGRGGVGGVGEQVIPVEEIEVEEDLEAGDENKEEDVVLQEGDAEIYSKKTPQEIGEGWVKAVTRGLMQQRLAGKVPASLQRLIDRLLEPKIDWRALLKQGIREGFGKTVVQTYVRTSRKVPSLPGIRRFTVPTTRVLVDTSGSIDNRELAQFLSEVYNICRLSPVSVYAWDAKVYKPVVAKTPSEVISKVARQMKGGGGTVINPCLKRVLKEMKPRDIIVCFTDGEIYDWGDSNTQELLVSVASKASVAILASVYRKPEPFPATWRYVKVEVNNQRRV